MTKPLDVDEGVLSALVGDENIPVQEKTEVVEAETDENITHDTIEPEEEKKEEPQEETAESVQVEEPQYTEEQQAAIRQGWKADGPLDAGEFLRRGELLDKISSLNKEVRIMRSSLEHQNKYMAKQQEVGYQQAIADLQSQINEAVAAGDVDQVHKLNEQVRDTEEAYREQKASPPSSVVEDFKTRHRHWIEDPSYEGQRIREFAHKRDEDLGKYNLAPEEHLRILEADLEKEFPTTFKTTKEPEIPTTSSVETSTSAPKTNKKQSGFDALTPEQKKVCRQFEKSGLMSRKEYLAQLKDLGEI